MLDGTVQDKMQTVTSKVKDVSIHGLFKNVTKIGVNIM